jgi:uncharacterized membrane protein
LKKNKVLNVLNLEKVINHISRFIELKLEIYELKLKGQMVGIISSFATLALIISFGLFMLFFCSLALGFYLNSIFESKFIGFLFVGLIYLLICILLIVFKGKIITNHLFQAFFSETLTRNNHEQDNDQQDNN